ncbi:TolC family protein [Polynucleobacter sp. JS-Fieb-80-E5]|uniref:TolC family protein n=1 Tax=Polynucleobacter sp. JS-Fieb-80-E5 TaxID=2081050 RepID=UPI001C0DC19C|nr:TolC family protein [Polynucleobacter sp. JS-Fieb-80-E5]MBU3618569.1 TolC family protein [Polynucleobacter sp. JS-Fieb-80-E5]
MYKPYRYLALFGTLGLLWCGFTHAVEFKSPPISIEQYLEIVRQNNSLIKNASLDVQIAGANKEAQSLYRISPTVSYSRGPIQNQTPYTPYNIPASNSYSLSFTVEGWGKRSAREKLSQSQINASTTQLENTSNDTQTNALFTYINTLRLLLIVNSEKATLDKLATYPSAQKVTDAQKFLKTQIAKTEKDLHFASLNLLNYSGDALKTPPLPKGNLNIPMQTYRIEDLIDQAQNNRAEVLNLMAYIEVADKNIDLTMKNRNVDVYPYIGQMRTSQYQYSNGANYSLPAIGPLPAQTINTAGTTYTAQNQITAGITIPIPINNFLQNADIVRAANQKLQNEMQLRDLKVQIGVQVLQASLQYEGAKENLMNAQKAYEAELKKPSADSVAKIMNVRDTEEDLLNSKTNHLKALINLWRQSGNYSVPTL